MTTGIKIKEELERRANRAFFEEIFELLVNDETERAGQRMLGVAQDVARENRELTRGITSAISIIKEHNKNWRNSTITYEEYIKWKTISVKQIHDIARDLQDILDSGTPLAAHSSPSSSVGR